MEIELLTSLASFFQHHHIPYMITGAWSVIFYGRPRASHDIDFVVELKPNDITRVLIALEDLDSAYVVQKEDVQEGIQSASIFQLIHRPTLLKVDAWLLTNDPFDQSRFRRRRFVRIGNKQTAIATAEDTILQKLHWYKQAKIEKHLVDAAFVYQIQNKSLDMKYLKKWAKTLGVTRYLKKLATIDLEQYF